MTEDKDKYLPKKNHVPSVEVPVESQLDRIERKLDVIIKALKLDAT